jgi:hypothetical protein
MQLSSPNIACFDDTAQLHLPCRLQPLSKPQASTEVLRGKSPADLYEWSRPQPAVHLMRARRRPRRFLNAHTAPAPTLLACYRGLSDIALWLPQRHYAR